MSRDRILSITRESWKMFQQMFARSIALAVLTALGFVVVDHLVDSGMTDRFAIVRRFPEFIPFMLAAAKLTFIEMSLFWVHFLVAPRFDMREAIGMANSTPTGAALVYLTDKLVWAFRLAVFIYLVG